MKNYYTKCKQCGKKIKDPADDPVNDLADGLIYIVRTDEYFCSQKCLTENAKLEV